MQSYLPRPLSVNRLGSSYNSGLDFGCTHYDRRIAVSSFLNLHFPSVVLSNQDKYHFNAIFLKIKINAKHLQCIKYERI